MNNVGVVISKVFPLARVISIKRIKKGCVNDTYEVKITNPKKELIFRLFPNEAWKAEKESYIYSLIKQKTNVPVPKIRLIDTSKKLYSNAFILLSKIKGRELKKSDKKLIVKAGEYLAKIHSIKFKKFGWIVGKNIEPKFNKWIDFCEYDLKLKLKNLKKYNPDKDMIKKLKQYFKENKSKINIKTKPCLIHKDYHFSHILVNKGKISGIIDVEWAMSGHNELDLAKSLMWMFNGNKELEKLFLKGYKKYHKLSKDFEKRREIYEILISTSSLLFSCQLKNNKWLKYNLKKIKSIIE